MRVGIDKGFVLILLLGTKKKKHFSLEELYSFLLGTMWNLFVFTLGNKKQKALSLINLRVCGERNVESQYARKKRELIIYWELNVHDTDRSFTKIISFNHGKNFIDQRAELYSY